jgi:hypothetical protein
MAIISDPNERKVELYKNNEKVDSYVFVTLCVRQIIKNKKAPFGTLKLHKKSGEYRGRTDDLLHAMQAL